MPILVIVDDLIFRGKITAAAEALHVPAQVVSRPPRGASDAWSLAIVDLNVSSCDPLDAVRTLHRAVPAAPILGYCAHVQAALQQQALSAGCTAVWPRSIFVQRLPELLTGTLAVV